MIPLSTLILKAHIGSTLYMAGVIWFVQIVHYPLFGLVGKNEFQTYERSHQTRTTFVVAGPMVIELLSGLYLVWQQSMNNSYPLLLCGLVLLGLIWASTFLIQVPVHEKLSRDSNSGLIFKLVTTNWIRTLAWTARALIVLFLF